MLDPALLAALAMVTATLTIIAWRRPIAAMRFAFTPRIVIFVLVAALVTARLSRSWSPPGVLLAIVVLAAIASFLSRAAEVTRVRRTIVSLGEPARRERATRFLSAWAKATRPGAGNAAAMRWYAPLVCSAAGAMLAHDYGDEACVMLERVPADLAEPRIAATRAGFLAMAHLARGRHADAHAALDAAPAEVPHAALQQMLSGARALLAAVEGRADDALAAAKELGDDPKLTGLLLAVEAHARAGRGERELAKAALGQLREAGGNQALERVHAHGGPASELAAELAK
jgi:hypothetical protein